MFPAPLFALLAYLCCARPSFVSPDFTLIRDFLQLISVPRPDGVGGEGDEVLVEHDVEWLSILKSSHNLLVNSRQKVSWFAWSFERVSCTLCCRFVCVCLFCCLVRLSFVAHFPFVFP